MERYFDAFLYVANWGTRRLMFRRTLLDAAVTRQYCHTETASVTETDSHVIISLSLDRDPDDNMIQADDWLAPMVAARADLAAGASPATAAVPRTGSRHHGSFLISQDSERTASRS